MVFSSDMIGGSSILKKCNVLIEVVIDGKWNLESQNSVAPVSLRLARVLNIKFCVCSDGFETVSEMILEQLGSMLWVQNQH